MDPFSEVTLDGFELRSSEVVPTAQCSPFSSLLLPFLFFGLVNDADASSIDVCFYRVGEREIIDVDQLPEVTKGGDIKLDPANVADLLDPEARPAVETPTRVVNEHQKNNIHYMNYSIPPIRKRKREATETKGVKEVAMGDSSGNRRQTRRSARPTARMAALQSMPPKKSTRIQLKKERKRQPLKSWLWRLDGVVEDLALPRGVLRIHYRTEIWGLNAKWIRDDDDDDDDEDEDEGAPVVPSQAENRGSCTGAPNAPNGSRNGTAEAPLSRDRGDHKLDQSGAASSQVRAMLDSPEDAAPIDLNEDFEDSGRIRSRSVPDTSEFDLAVHRNSSVLVFFEAMASSVSRSVADYRDVIDKILADNIVDVNEMLQIPEESWMDRYLVGSWYSVQQRKHLRTAILASLKRAQVVSDALDLT